MKILQVYDIRKERHTIVGDDENEHNHAFA